MDIDDIPVPHPHDKVWVSQQIGLLPFNMAKFARDKYYDVFEQAYEKEAVEHKKMNVARREANTRLRIYVENVVGKV